ncbi:hypothetical protein [Nocardia wallacei]|uniref:hypothetical protein n=1 Tax=Nocardia wallacei TaxID=480035 RepID=UPI002457C8EC|nr:hypothetical protein [Nocardia wallacei]
MAAVLRIQPHRRRSHDEHFDATDAYAYGRNQHAEPKRDFAVNLKNRLPDN